MFLIRIVLINTFLLISIGSFTQTNPVEISKNTVVLAGKKYYLHKVLPNQTLYSISKAYDVSVTDILKINYKSTTTLSINEELKIPYKKITSTKTKIVTPKGESLIYRFHRVQHGETVYSISKKYNVPIHVILKINNKTDYRLFIGENLKIPVKKQTEEKEIENNIEEFKVIEEKPKEEESKIVSSPKPAKVYIPENYYDRKYFYYFIKKGETRYSVAKKFNLRVRKFLRYNKWLKQTNIKEGDKVRVPKKFARREILELELKRTEREIEERITPVEEQTEDTIALAEVESIIDTVPIIAPQKFKKRYAIALLLPISNSETILKFYQGILIGLEEYSNQSAIGVDLYTYNIEKDSAQIERTLGELLMYDIDVIIGPFDQESFNQVAFFGYTYSIPVISLATMYNDLADNSSVIQLNTSYKTIASLISQYVTHNHSNDNIIVSHADTSVYFSRNEFADMDIDVKINAIKDTIIHQLANESFNYDKKIQVKHFVEILSKDSTNVVIIPCVKSSNVIRILSSLYAAKGLNDIKIIVYGMPVWQFYEDIDPTIFYSLNIQYFSPFYVDYQDNHVKDFIRKFRQKFMAQPHQISLRGFDAIWFTLAGLEKFGNHFIYNLNNHSPFLLNSSFTFKKYENGGFENIQVYKVVYNPNYTIGSTLYQID